MSAFLRKLTETYTAWKVSKYGVFSGPYFSVFGLNTGKYGPEKIPYWDTFHAVTYLGSCQASIMELFCKNS